jgi:iron complex transport system substrate-binding protein
VIDATGTHVQVPEHPVRVVTLAPSLAELAADLLGEDLQRIAGVSEYTDFPPVLEKKPSIGPYVRVNLEKIMALKPDLVLATSDGNSKDQVVHLRELGLAVVVVNTATLKQVEDSFLLVGKALDTEKRGQEMIAQLRKGLGNIRARAAKRPHPTVLLQLGSEPLIVVGRESFLSEALETVGARNVYADNKDHYPRPALEDAVHRDPEIILVMAMGKDLAPFYAMARSWSRFPGMAAVKNKRVQVIQSDTVLRPSLRLLEGLGLLERAIYGQAK